MARKEIRNSRGAMQGEGLAKAGIVLGWIGVGLAVMGICLVVLMWAGLFGGSLGLGICANLGNGF
jgi:hypothetical protein